MAGVSGRVVEGKIDAAHEQGRNAQSGLKSWLKDRLRLF
jgi:hypothetical protein